MFRSELGHNLELILDCKTQWNFLADMIIMFVKLQKFIEEALLELNLDSDSASLENPSLQKLLRF
jgi:hypothetical protein